MNPRHIIVLLASAVMLSGCGGSEIGESDITAIKIVTSPPQTVKSSTTTTTAAPPPTVTEETTTTEITTAETTAEPTTTTEETTTTTVTTPETTAATTTVTTAQTTTTTTATSASKATEPPAPPAPVDTSELWVETFEDKTCLSWGKAENADGYVVMMQRSGDGEWEKVAETAELSVTLKGIGRNKNYSFSILTYRLEEGEKVTGDLLCSASFPYMVRRNGITYVDGMMIVNKTYGLPKTYNPGLSAETQKAFSEMAVGARKDGLSIWICSGFRNYNYQDSLYWNYVRRDGSQASADKYSARAGFSEHQSGLAVDVNQASRYFNGSPVAVWLEKNCWKYGFIIRYPQGKESITGYNYESWHCRYVGKDKAKMFHENGLTVEEYYGLTSVYAN